MPTHFHEQESKQGQESKSPLDPATEFDSQHLTFALPPNDQFASQRNSFANESSQVQQQSRLQEVANHSSEVVQLKQRQEQINSTLASGSGKRGRRSFPPPSLQLTASSENSNPQKAPVQKKPLAGKPVIQRISVQIEPLTGDAQGDSGENEQANNPSGNPVAPVTDMEVDESSAPDVSLSVQAPATEEMNVDEEPQRMKIGVLRVKGRPKNVYSRSAGDHVTAFGVYQSGFENAMQNHTLDEALVFCMEEFEAIKRLEMNSRMIKKRRGEYRDLLGKIGDALTEIGDILNQRPIRPELDQLAALKFQVLVGDLLSLQEMSRLSTVNSRLVDPDRTGKGKGEAPRLGFLRYQENRLKTDRTWPELEKKETINALMDVFDFDSIAGNMMAPREKWPDVLGGIEPDISIDNLFGILWHKHFGALCRAYPKIMKNLHDADSGHDSLMKTFKDRLAEFVNATSLELQETLWNSRLSILRELRSVNHGVLPKRDPFRERELERRKIETQRLKQKMRDEENRFTDLEGIRSFFGHPARSFVWEENRLDMDSFAPQPPRSVNDIREIDSSYSTMDPVPDPVVYAELWTNPFLGDQEQKKKYFKKSRHLGASGEAVQISMKEDDPEKIDSVDFGSRPNSPLSGTMGAHTTAWTIHERGVKKAIIGKNALVAKTNLDGLLGKSKVIKEERQGQFSGDYEDFQVDQLQASLVEAERIRDAAEEAGAYPILHLQKYISAYLQFVNYTWGTAFDVSETKGRNEANSCKNIERVLEEWELVKDRITIDDYVRSQKEYLMYQISMLLDIVQVPAEFHPRLIHDHWIYMVDAYPELKSLTGEPIKVKPGKQPKKPNIAQQFGVQPAPRSNGNNKAPQKRSKKRHNSEVIDPLPNSVVQPSTAPPVAPTDPSTHSSVASGLSSNSSTAPVASGLSSNPSRLPSAKALFDSLSSLDMSRVNMPPAVNNPSGMPPLSGTASSSAHDTDHPVVKRRRTLSQPIIPKLNPRNVSYAKPNSHTTTHSRGQRASVDLTTGTSSHGSRSVMPSYHAPPPPPVRLPRITLLNVTNSITGGVTTYQLNLDSNIVFAPNGFPVGHVDPVSNTVVWSPGYNPCLR